MSMTASPRHDPVRGEVWLVDFDPSVGAEMQKQRRAIVLSVPEVRPLPLRIVVPVTGWKPGFSKHPWKVRLAPSLANGLTRDVCADGFQVKSVSVNRFVKKMGTLTGIQIEEIAAAVVLCIGYQPA